MRDPQDETPVDKCCICGGEIYHGDHYWATDEGFVHDEPDCVFEYVKKHCSTFEVMTSLLIPRRTVTA